MEVLYRKPYAIGVAGNKSEILAVLTDMGIIGSHAESASADVPPVPQQGQFVNIPSEVYRLFSVFKCDSHTF